MRYHHFEINNYRAIVGPMRIEVAKKSLFPIIGINESGKTTVLQAIFAFDHYNDELNGGRHLEDIANLYSTSPGLPTVTAAIECTREDLREMLDEVDESLSPRVAGWKRKKVLPARLTITRDLKTKKYSIAEPPFKESTAADALAKRILAHLPYILYFDDFRDKVDERIEIPADPNEVLSGWVAIIEQLFHQTDDDLSIFQLALMEERQRKSTIAKVQRHLNRTLTKEWQNFRLDDSDALEIGLEFEPHPAGGLRGYLRLEIVERDANGDDHYFFISDRSKGFYWFFNFVMKLEFNPKVLADGDQGSIYLLDEPGSYLHATAQAKLCTKLRTLAENNTVIYCTHSHYLLNPEVIPLSSIAVADKDGNGHISLVPIHAHEGNILERRSAFQPVIDALQIKPFMVDLTHSRAVIVEGIYDYYALELFRQQRPVSVIPSVGAESVKFYVSPMIAWQVRFRALWDHDEAGRKCRDAALRIFGDELGKKAFLLLPSPSGGKRILQDLFDSADLQMVRAALKLDGRPSFEKTMAALFFSDRRAELANRMGAATRQNFAEVWDALVADL